MNRKDRRKFAKTINTPQKLEGYGANLERRIRAELQKKYDEKFENELGQSIDIFILTIIYTLHFNEKTKFGNSRIDNFMTDLFATVDMFRTGECNPDEYMQELEKDGINLIFKNGGIK